MVSSYSKPRSRRLEKLQTPETTYDPLDRGRTVETAVIGDWTDGLQRRDFRTLNNDDAMVYRQQTDVLGIYRDEIGELHAVDAVCPHLGCLVQWNDGERTWDCPCHGSRFEIDGRVINGPANADLSQRDL
jgi:Rieske Fe-S protein